jgi:hypothetical protein
VASSSTAATALRSNCYDRCSREMEAPTKEGGALTQTAKELIALLVAMLMVVGLGLV